MIVREALRNLELLLEAGYGDLPLICIDGRSGDTNELGIDSDVTIHEEQGDAGILCDFPIGESYVHCYIG